MVTLISSVQLALLLVAVMTLFSWFSKESESTLENQACTDNQAIGRQLERAIEKSGITLTNLSDRPDSIEKLEELFSDFHMPNYGFVSVVDAKTSKAILNYPDYPSLEGTALGMAELKSDAGFSMPLAKLYHAKSSGSEKGIVAIEGRDHFVATERLSEELLLVVAQQKSEMVAAMKSTLTSAQQVFFAATLLVGLGCICLTVSILNRMTAKVDDLSAGLERQVTDREKQIVRTQNAVIFGLAKLAESRDNDTGEHLDRIRSYVMILSEDLKSRFGEVDNEFVNTIALASSLHDVGKVGIPDSILLKPGRLTKEEREVMELHTLIGGECLEAIQSRLGDDNRFMQIAKQVAYYHHERWDGTGYPHGLSGNDIPLVARIVAVADVYDALTSKRPYKQPLSHIESKGIILAGSGSQFDPEVVDAFLRHEEQFESISRSQSLLTDEDVLSEFHMLCERAQKSADQEAASNGA